MYRETVQALYQPYNALGQWINDHDYEVQGMTYEVFYRVDDHDNTVEIQIPLKEG